MSDYRNTQCSRRILLSQRYLLNIWKWALVNKNKVKYIEILIIKAKYLRSNFNYTHGRDYFYSPEYKDQKAHYSIRETKKLKYLAKRIEFANNSLF